MHKAEFRDVHHSASSEYAGDDSLLCTIGTLALQNYSPVLLVGSSATQPEEGWGESSLDKVSIDTKG